MNDKNARRAELLDALDRGNLQGAIAGFIPGGAYEVYHNGELVEIAANIVPAAARSYLLKAGVAGGAQISAWYGMPFINAVDPTDALTAANFDATLDEFTNYSEATRPAWVQEAESGQAIVNGTTLMSITIGAGADQVINGFALVSTNTKGGSGGTLLSAFRFAAERPVQEGDVLEFKYTVQAQPAA